MSEKLSEKVKKQKDTALQVWQEKLEKRRAALIQKQTQERNQLKVEQEKRQADEAKERQASFNKGLRGLIDRLTGKHRKVKALNKLEAMKSKLRDQQGYDTLIVKQAQQRTQLEVKTTRLEEVLMRRNLALSIDIAQYHDIRKSKHKSFDVEKPSRINNDQNPTLEF